MEAVVFFIFFGIYILIRVLLGGGASAWEKQSLRYKEGIHLFRLKNFEGARFYFEKQLKRRPYDSVHLVFLGEISLHDGEFERALAYGSRALRLDNTIWQAHLMMAKAFYFLQNQEQALKNAKNAVWFGRKEPDALHWYGKLLVEKGEVEKGLEHLAEAYRLGDEDSGPYLRNRRFSSNL